MKRLSILLAILSLSISWQTGTNSALGARETSPTVEFALQSTLAQSASGGWIIVDFPAYRGHFTSIAVDSNDLIHISHINDGNLMYTRQFRVGDDIWWATYTVITATDLEYTSLTLDENDRPYIAYYDATAQNLCWAWSPADGTWYTGTRNTAGIIDGSHTSAVVRGGILRVAYLNLTTYNVEYIEIIPGGGWPPTPQVVGGSPSFEADVSLALRSDGLPRISYSTTSGELVYARYTGSAWALEVIDGDVEHKMGECNSLALNADNRARIAYFDATNRDLRHISYGLIGWGVPAIVDDSLGEICYTSLALDGTGSSHILYYDGNVPGSLRYAQRQNGSWSTETVDGSAPSCGMHSALALDSLGHPHASYYCGHLKYAYRAFTVYLPVVMRGQ